MARRSFKVSEFRQTSSDRVLSVLIVIIIASGAFVAAGYGLTGRLSISLLLVALGGLWLSAVAILSGAAHRRIDGVEPQTLLIALGLAIMLFPDPLAVIFILVVLFSGFLWARRGFRL